MRPEPQRPHEPQSIPALAVRPLFAKLDSIRLDSVCV